MFDDLARLEEEEVIRNGEGVLGVVGDEKGGGTGFLEDGLDFEAEARFEEGIEAAEGLVEQE